MHKHFFSAKTFINIHSPRNILLQGEGEGEGDPRDTLASDVQARPISQHVIRE